MVVRTVVRVSANVQYKTQHRLVYIRCTIYIRCTKTH